MRAGSTMIPKRLLMTPAGGGLSWSLGRAADQGAGEELADQSEARVLVLAEGKDGAERLCEHHAGFGRRRASRVDEDARLDRPLLIVGDADLAERDAAGSEVEDHRRLI